MTQAIEIRRPALAEARDDGPASSVVAVQQNEQSIVVVIGMHRSGTSLCSHILSMLGVDMTDDIDAQPSNARGQWERLDLRDFHDRILGLFDRGFYHPNHDLPLPAAWWADPQVRAVREDIVGFLRRRMPARTLFGFKDPRVARLLPVWRQVFEALRLSPKFVLCLRNPAQVARSLAARDGLSPEIGECRWFCYMAEALGNLRDCQQLCTVEYEDWFIDPTINLKKLTRFLDLTKEYASTELRIAISQIVDPYLRHDGPGPGEARQTLVRSLYQIARSFADERGARESVGRLVDQFAAFRELYRPVHDTFEKLSKLAAKLPQCEARATEREAEIAEADRRNTELAAVLATAESELASLRAELDRALRTTVEQEDIADAAQSAIDKLRASLAQSQQQMAERLSLVESERNTVCEERDRLAQERDEVCEERDRLAQERDEVCEERDRLAQERDEVCEERDRLAAESAQWFDAVILMPAERITRGHPRRGWRLGRYRVQISPVRGQGSPMQRADRARAARQWGRAARFYIEALDQGLSDRSAIWVQLGHALKEAGRAAEAEFAYRQAMELDGRNADVLVSLGRLLQHQGRNAETAAVYRRALEHVSSTELCAFLSGELAALSRAGEMPQSSEMP